MTELVVIVPSRGRPEAARTLARVFTETCTADTQLVFAIDGDDPERPEYTKFLQERPARCPYGIEQPTGTMVSALNSAALTAATRDAFAVGFFGDDHCPRTYGWDTAYVDTLRELGTGIVYGNDLLQGERIPTQVAMTSDIIRTLGFMAPPALTHLFVDNFWLDLGVKAECIRYLPDVIVEHRHPIAGKADWDAGYARVNDARMYQADGTAYAQYAAERLAEDVAKVRALR
jgi:hypothetical protein